MTATDIWNLRPGVGCRAIVCDREKLFCNEPGYPWCAGHRRLFYRPAPQQVRKRNGQQKPKH